MIAGSYASQREVQRILSIKIEKVLSYYGLRFDGRKQKQKLFCPFHAETKPSFFVKNNYAYCFGCGKSWDAIQLIRDKENCRFFPALQRLCEIEGLNLTIDTIRKIHRSMLKLRKPPEEAVGSRALERVALGIQKTFIDYYQSLPCWREFFTTYIEHLWEEYDTIVAGGLTREKIDQLKDWFFTSKLFLKNNHYHWKKLPLLQREAWSERTGEDLGT